MPAEGTLLLGRGEVARLLSLQACITPVHGSAAEKIDKEDGVEQD